MELVKVSLQKGI